MFVNVEYNSSNHPDFYHKDEDKNKIRLVRVEIEPKDTIKNLKSKIQDIEGFPCDEQIIFTRKIS